MKQRYAVIMAGGKGERFWPQSRLQRPKHLLPIVGELPMLTQTVQRLLGIVDAEHILVITNAEQRKAVEEVCAMLPVANIIAEPVGRDTAAAVGLAAIVVGQRDAEATFAILPSDHVIHDTEAFHKVMESAFAAAEAEDALITVGIEPLHAATGYGYIKRGEKVHTVAGMDVYAVGAFREKPDAVTAQMYLDSGEYVWNAGMFFWRVPVIQDALQQLTPGLWNSLQAIREGLEKGTELDVLLTEHYPHLEKISVDYAIMEKAAKVRVIGAVFDWDDVGEWPAVERHFAADASGNVIRGSGIVQGGKGNILYGEKGHLIAAIGVDDLIIVQTGDATLICPKSKAQDIKQLVQRLAKDAEHTKLL